MKERSEYVKEVFDSNGGSYGYSSDVYNYPENIPFRVINGNWLGVVRHNGDSRLIYKLDKHGEDSELPVGIKEDFHYGLVLEPANFEEQVSGTYRHYKGGIYYAIGLARHTENGESLVVYEDEKKNVWCRPEKMFFDSLVYEGTFVKRFRKIG